MKPANLTAGQRFLQYEILRGLPLIIISSEKPNFAHMSPQLHALRRQARNVYSTAACFS
jgi:hypothetical protein